MIVRRDKLMDTVKLCSVGIQSFMHLGLSHHVIFYKGYAIGFSTLSCYMAPLVDTGLLDDDVTGCIEERTLVNFLSKCVDREIDVSLDNTRLVFKCGKLKAQFNVIPVPGEISTAIDDFLTTVPAWENNVLPEEFQKALQWCSVFDRNESNSFRYSGMYLNGDLCYGTNGWELRRYFAEGCSFPEARILPEDMRALATMRVKSMMFSNGNGDVKRLFFSGEGGEIYITGSVTTEYPIKSIVGMCEDADAGKGTVLDFEDGAFFSLLKRAKDFASSETKGITTAVAAITRGYISVYATNINGDFDGNIDYDGTAIVPEGEKSVEFKVPCELVLPLAGLEGEFMLNELTISGTKQYRIFYHDDTHTAIVVMFK